MQLREWLIKNGKTPDQFRREIGLSASASVYRYLCGKRIPRPEIMERIRQATNGEVQPNDFFKDEAA